MTGSRAEWEAEIFSSMADWKVDTFSDRTEYSVTSWLRSMNSVVLVNWPIL